MYSQQECDSRKDARLARLTVLASAVALLGCGGSRSADQAETVPLPLPVAAMVGVDVVVYPLTMILAEAALGWDLELAPREAALRNADSLIAAALTSRTPEVTWVLADKLRRAARLAPGMLSNPDRMGTAALRHNVRRLPDPLRSQLRSLTGAAGDRLALIPASLFFFRDEVLGGRAELTVVLVDVRMGEVLWRSVAQGTGETPSMALRAALETLAPGLP